MSAVFVDTSALLPFLDRDDRDHTNVVSGFRRLFEEDVPLVTTSYVLVEAGALVKARLGQEAFRALGRLVDEAMDVVWVDPELHRAGWTQAAASGRNGPSLVDCVSFAVMREQGIDKAFTLDRHFKQQGFALVP